LREGEVVEHGSTVEVLQHPRHEYTQVLIAEHERYGLDKFLDPKLEVRRVR
jgi:peptide/nickel transport system ATP-binding protein